MKARNIFIAALLLLSLSVLDGYAQYGYGGYGGYGSGYRSPMAGSASMRSGPDMPEKREKIDLVAVTGLFLVDIKPIVEKCKISKQATIDKITDVVVLYQEEYDRISFEFTMEIDQIIELQYLIEEDDASNQAEIQAMMKVVREPMQKIHKRCLEMHSKLVDDLSNVLSEKEAKRWRLYYRRLCGDNGFQAAGAHGRDDENDGEVPEGGGPGGHGGPGDM